MVPVTKQDPNDVDSSSTSTTSVAEAVNPIIPESAGREIQISGKAHPAHDGQLGRLKQSDSSFGLHSPDNLGPLGFHQHQEVGGGGQGGGGGQVQVSSFGIWNFVITGLPDKIMRSFIQKCYSSTQFNHSVWGSISCFNSYSLGRSTSSTI